MCQYEIPNRIKFTLTQGQWHKWHRDVTCTATIFRGMVVLWSSTSIRSDDVGWRYWFQDICYLFRALKHGKDKKNPFLLCCIIAFHDSYSVNLVLYCYAWRIASVCANGCSIAQWIYASMRINKTRMKAWKIDWY